MLQPRKSEDKMQAAALWRRHLWGDCNSVITFYKKLRAPKVFFPVQKILIPPIRFINSFARARSTSWNRTVWSSIFEGYSFSSLYTQIRCRFLNLNKKKLSINAHSSFIHKIILMQASTLSSLLFAAQKNFTRSSNERKNKSKEKGIYINSGLNLLTYKRMLSLSLFLSPSTWRVLIFLLLSFTSSGQR